MLEQIIQLMLGLSGLLIIALAVLLSIYALILALTLTVFTISEVSTLFVDR